MLLTKEQKKAMLEYAKRHKRTKNEEWLARHFSDIPQGWKEEEDEEEEEEEDEKRKRNSKR